MAEYSTLITSVLSAYAIAVSFGITKAFIDIQILKKEVDRLEKDRITHEEKNTQSFEKIFDLLRKIEHDVSVLIGKTEK